MSRIEGTARAILGAVGSYSPKQIEEIIVGLLADIDQLRAERDAAVKEVKTLKTKSSRDNYNYGASNDGDWDAE